MIRIKKFSHKTFSLGFIATSCIFSEPVTLNQVPQELSSDADLYLKEDSHHSDKVNISTKKSNATSGLSLLEIVNAAADENEFVELNDTDSDQPFNNFDIAIKGDVQTGENNNPKQLGGQPSGEMHYEISRGGFSPLFIAGMAGLGITAPVTIQVNNAAAAQTLIDNQSSLPSASKGNALLGGGVAGVSNTPLAYTISVNNAANLTPTPITGISSSGEFISVSINAAGTQGLLGGNNFFNGPLLYTVDVTNSSATQISAGLSPTGSINSVAISELGTLGLVGGDDGSNVPIAYTVGISNGLLTAISSADLPTAGTVLSIAIDTKGDKGLIGGGDTLSSNPPFALIVDMSNPTSPTVTNISLSSTAGIVNSVAIDQTGTNGIIGLVSNPSPDAAFTIVGTTAHPVTFTTSPDEIASVAINRAGTFAILGGNKTINPTKIVAKAYVVSDFVNPTAAEISGITNTTGGFQAVAIDSLGTIGLFGGTDLSLNGFAYVIDIANHSATAITLPVPAGTESGILTVEIQDLGRAGLLGGVIGSDAAAFLLPDLVNNPTQAILLNLTGTIGPSGSIFSVSFDAIVNLLNHIPTAGLSGNNLKLANYLNENAPNTASYFMPSVLDGTLSQALESVAPTRNASPLFALNNTFFTFSEGISRRARDARQSMNRQDQNDCSSCHTNGLLNEIWGEVVGLDAYQNKQHQTPRFQPLSIGFIFGYDAEKNTNSRMGLALSYIYTHLHQGEHAGHNTINQEYFSLYGLWNPNSFYLNTALWAGLFQIHSERHIHMTAFDFNVHSFRTGVQFDPHVEFGYDVRFGQCCNYTFEPFAMLDWIHTWQVPFLEIGDGPFKFIQQHLHASMFRTEAGFRFYERFGFCSWNLILQENVSYIYRKPFSIGDVKGFLLGSPGTLSLETFTSAQNLGSVELRFLFEPICSQYPSGTVGYKAEFGSGYQSHEVTLGTEWNF